MNIQACKTKSEVLNKINRLSGLDIFLEVLLILCSKNLNHYSDELSTRNNRSLLNINELSLLFGFWLKNKNKNCSGIYSVNELCELLHSLMDRLHQTFLPDYSNINFEELMLTGDFLQETIFYSGTGAYDYQYVKFAIKEYQLDNEWLISNKEIDINSLLPFYSFFKGNFHYKLNYTNLSTASSELYKYSKNSYIFEKYPEFKKILSAFSIKEKEILNQDFSTIGDQNEFNFRPILEYHSYYLIPIPFLLSQALNKSPYYWLTNDEKYKTTSLTNRGKCAENIVFNLLKNKYGTSILQNVLVKINKTKTITDLDVCIVFNEILIIFQIKSKKLTQLSKQGDVNQIKNDFKSAVTDAYEQANKAVNPILNKSCKLYDKENRIIADTSNITEIYTVCILLDDYPPITSHTRIFNEKKDHIPIAISIYDLEICIEYLPNLESFIDYIKKRTKNSKYFRAETELSLLNFYLNNNLNQLENADGVLLDNDFALQFDDDYYKKLIFENENNFDFFVQGIKESDYCFCGSGSKFKDCCLQYTV
ncbi:SEC-C domain-containing protein [Aquirufa ecclesiirivi]|uniref:SEC-C domain-containing protein n=1 Tax=Aquirufa ecclesiirivi TaxID=2715124 RepID=UPI003BAF7972